MDLYDELKAIVSSLRAHEIPYALCGGLALAVHGIPRATIDIDLLVEKKSVGEIKKIAHGLGFTVDSGVMRMKRGGYSDPSAHQARRAGNVRDGARPCCAEDTSSAKRKIRIDGL